MFGMDLLRIYLIQIKLKKTQLRCTDPKKLDQKI